MPLSYYKTRHTPVEISPGLYYSRSGIIIDAASHPAYDRPKETQGGSEDGPTEADLGPRDGGEGGEAGRPGSVGVEAIRDHQ